MVVAEVLTGLALLNKSVDFIKTNLNTAKDISAFAESIGNILDAEDQIQKGRSKKAKMGIADQFGLKTVASEIIDAKLAAEKRYEISVAIDMRFGSGTWKSIVDERARRIQEAKEQAKEQAKKAKQKQDEIMEVVGIVLVILTVCGLGMLLLYILSRTW
tara:strand:+ start:1054 stop:1530 length:477 start_codon:yes stop_codon:yes gene_type:complete